MNSVVIALSKICQHTEGGVPQNFVQAFMVPKGLPLLILVILSPGGHCIVHDTVVY